MSCNIDAEGLNAIARITQLTALKANDMDVLSVDLSPNNPHILAGGKNPGVQHVLSSLTGAPLWQLLNAPCYSSMLGK